ncbi:transposase [Psychrobacter sp. AOP29-E1-7]
MGEDKASYCFTRAQGESCTRVARFHKNKRIQKLINRYSHRTLWLPPYSPDLNPIEKKWAQAKL